MQSRRARKLAQTAAIAALAWLQAPAAHAQPDADVAAAVGACQRVPTRQSRLDCYDRAFPPLVDTQTEETAARGQRSEEARREASAEPRRDEQNAPAARERRNVTAAERAPAYANHAQIIELKMPRITTTELIAADGRVFVRESATSILRWPNVPFDVDIETSRFGSSTYLIHPQSRQRVRVAVRD
jgi:hypothetical protein